MISGVLYALLAGLMWGLIFVGPLIVPEYPAVLQSMGRYLALGLIALPIARVGTCAPASTRAERLVNCADANNDGESDLLRLHGKRYPAHRRTGLHHDYWYIAGGDPGLR